MVTWNNNVSPIVLYILLILVACIVAILKIRYERHDALLNLTNQHRYDDNWSGSRKETEQEKVRVVYKKRLKKTISVAVLVAFLATNAITILGSVFYASYLPEARTGTYHDAAMEFGLENNKAYPLVIGGVTGGNSGSINLKSGLFTASAAANFRPSTAITLSFSQENASWILTIPTDKVTFHVNNDTEPTMAIQLSSADYRTAESWQNEYDSQWQISNLALTYVSWYQNPDPILMPEVRNLGLAPVVNEGVGHVDISLPQELYDQVFNLS